MKRIQAKILIVDDEPNNLRALAKILNLDNITVVLADSGMKALDITQCEEFAVILLDVQMPVIDGFDIASKIRCQEKNKKTPILFITGKYIEEQDIFEGYERGAIDFIIKPINRKVMVSKVQIFVDLYLYKKDLSDIAREKAVLIQHAGEGIIGIDVQGKITSVNPAACQLLNYDLDELEGCYIHKVTEPSMLVDNSTETLNILMPVHGESQTKMHRGEFYKKNGSKFPVEYSCVGFQATINKSGYVIIFRDITERVEKDHKLLVMAKCDPLTGLANRAMFQEFLPQAMARSNRHHQYMGVLLIDVDYFKDINDNHGHQRGDMVLVYIAKKIKSCLREVDLVARLGGDEFAVVLDDIVSPEGLGVVANNILESIKPGFTVDGKNIQLSLSIGGSVFPEDAKGVDDLLHAADLAMYESKKKGRGQFSFFNAAMQKKEKEFYDMLKRMRKAMLSKEFEIYYQPLVNASNYQIIGAEALIRWRVQGEYIPPDKFLPMANRFGLINGLGLWQMQVIFQELVNIEKNNTLSLPFTINMNASFRQLTEEKFLPAIQSNIDTFQIEPKCFKLEITEDSLLDKPEAIISLLDKLQSMGIRIALDDFGTGYSSLSYVHQLPIDTLKLDKSFVQKIGQSLQVEEIILSTITLAHKLNMDVVAEGVETQKQVDFLKDCQCDILQGFYFSQAVPKEQLAQLLKNGVDFNHQKKSYS